MNTVVARLFVFLQHLLPKFLLTSLVYRLARVRTVAIKDFLIRRFVAAYKVETGELIHPVPSGYPTFNDFFIRELAEGARPVDAATGSIISPVDGTVSAAGVVQQERIFQAKGLDYSLTDLLATDVDDAARYVDGAFATIYLAPYNYHRVHAPLDGELTAARYVPGALYSVNAATVGHLDGLFVRNERLICHFRGDQGPFVVVFVGALNVGTINSRWTGDTRPRATGVVEQVDLRQSGASPRVTKGDTLGWFNMGSTVILLMPPGTSDAFAALEPGQTVRMGEPIGHLQAIT